jgi:hypothetical protein
MPSTELNDKLQSLMLKVKDLGRRFAALKSENKALSRQSERQQLEIARLEKELKQLRIDNEFLRVAHSVPAKPEAVAQYKKQVAKMVRDIDRCIKQLKA